MAVEPSLWHAAGARRLACPADRRGGVHAISLQSGSRMGHPLPLAVLPPTADPRVLGERRTSTTVSRAADAVDSGHGRSDVAYRDDEALAGGLIAECRKHIDAGIRVSQPRGSRKRVPDPSAAHSDISGQYRIARDTGIPPNPERSHRPGELSDPGRVLKNRRLHRVADMRPTSPQASRRRSAWPGNRPCRRSCRSGFHRPSRPRSAQ